ncbi:MAG: hypothetical protein K0A89_00325 [ANME-2 cluster archaeon]|nr:hypothetical protein [ANME-2 cluster archaeon]
MIAMNRIQEVRFKERGVGLQSDEIRCCMDSMREQGAYGAGIEFVRADGLCCG